MSKLQTNLAFKTLAAIARDEGMLRAESVIAHASDANSPLHGYFEWDDGTAAHQYRLDQARRLIRCAVTVLPGVESECRAFVSLVPDRSRAGGGYRSMVGVMTNAEQREQLLSQALDALNRVRTLYAELTALAPIFKAMDAVERRRIRRQASRAAGM